MNQDEVNEAVERITKEWADKGKIIEGGWRALEYLTLRNVPAAQRPEIRKVFFAGAQHLFASILNILEPGADPTANDLRRMDLIERELRQYVESCKVSITNN
jgi:hypothetical protein